jgi:GNAT superfamily N-acetyltransferase
MTMIRLAQKGDEHAIMELIHGLALYEKAPEQVVNTAEALAIHLFDEKICESIVAEKDGKIVGFALYFTNYSTWKGKCLYLEDFYVLPELRKEGIGSLLFDEVVRIAKERGVKRMDWQVLEWNEPALNFYKKKEAILDPEWINGRFFFD